MYTSINDKNTTSIANLDASDLDASDYYGCNERNSPLYQYLFCCKILHVLFKNNAQNPMI